jgi:hypothetical protein
MYQWNARKFFVANYIASRQCCLVPHTALTCSAHSGTGRHRPAGGARVRAGLGAGHDQASQRRAGSIGCGCSGVMRPFRSRAREPRAAAGMRGVIGKTACTTAARLLHALLHGCCMHCCTAAA